MARQSLELYLRDYPWAVTLAFLGGHGWKVTAGGQKLSWTSIGLPPPS